jgi:ATP-binding cassette subfamily C (CFTR/MRP) protein 10
MHISAHVLIFTCLKDKTESKKYSYFSSSLARAIYQDKEIYLIDDVFSAVDVPVGKQIYQKCIQGLLRNKTKIVCTHHPRFLAGANTVLLLEKGRVVQDGPAHEVLSDVNFGDEEAKKRSSSRNESESERKDDSAEADEVLAAADQGIVDEETRGRGRVKLSVFKEYLRAVGTPLSIAILMSLAMMQATKNLTDVWLAEWVTAVKADNHANPSVVNFYLPVYGGIAGANSLFAFARAFLFAYGGICAAKAIHKSLIGAVIHAKPSFFSGLPN